MGRSGIQARQSNMELLRILAAAGVIVLHFNAKALPVTPLPAKLVLLPLELLSACAVNLFVMISGYFLGRRESVSIQKPLALLTQLVVFRLVMHLVELAAGSAEFTGLGLLMVLVPTDYFIVLYCALYLLSPFINRVLALQGGEKLHRFLLLLFLLFSVWNYALDALGALTGVSFAGGSTVGIQGAQEGYTLVNFVLCYCVGAAMGTKALSVKKPGLVLLGCLAGELAISRLSLYLAIEYLSPLVICQAAAVLALAEKLHFESAPVNFLASGALSVYMIHMHVLARFDPASCAERSFFGTLGYLAAAVLLIYALGLAAGRLYEAAAGPIWKKICQRVTFPEIRV